MLIELSNDSGILRSWIRHVQTTPTFKFPDDLFYSKRIEKKQSLQEDRMSQPFAPKEVLIGKFPN